MIHLLKTMIILSKIRQIIILNLDYNIFLSNQIENKVSYIR